MDQSNKSNLLFAEYQVNFSPSNSKLNVIGGLLVSKTNSKSPLYSGDHTSENYASYIQFGVTINSYIYFRIQYWSNLNLFFDFFNRC